MALVFRCYFAESIQAALHGDVREKANYQIHCGPAMGAFNGFAKDTSLSDWRNRHVDVMADELMTRAAARIDELLRRFGSVHELQPRRMTVGGEDGIRTHL